MISQFTSNEKTQEIMDEINYGISRGYITDDNTDTVRLTDRMYSTVIDCENSNKFFIDTTYHSNEQKIVTEFFYGKGYTKPFLTLRESVAEKDITDEIMDKFHAESCKVWRKLLFTFNRAS